MPPCSRAGWTAPWTGARGITVEDAAIAQARARSAACRARACCSAKTESLAHLLATRRVSSRGTASNGSVIAVCARTRPGEQDWRNCGSGRWRAPVRRQDRRRRRAGFGNHVHRIGRDNDAVGPGEAPGKGCRRRLDPSRPGGLGRGSDRESRSPIRPAFAVSRRSARCPLRAPARRRVCQAGPRRRFAIEAGGAGRAAEQHAVRGRGSRPGRGNVSRAPPARRHRRDEATDHGDDIRADQRVVLGRDDQVPMAGG